MGADRRPDLNSIPPQLGLATAIPGAVHSFPFPLPPHCRSWKGLHMAAPILTFCRDFAAPVPTSPTTSRARVESAVVRAASWLVSRQQADGGWAGQNRITATAQALGALPAESAEVARGWTWLWNAAILRQDGSVAPSELDSLVVLDALVRSRLSTQAAGQLVIRDAIESLRSLQNADGGWGLADNTGGEAADSDAATTGAVLSVFATCGHIAGDSSVERAIDYLEREQPADSGWLSSATSGHFDGTLRVLLGLRAAGIDNRFACVCRAAAWLKRLQALDGGWGSPGVAGGAPTPEDTAAATLGLLAASESDSAEVEAAVAWLLDHQQPDASWSGATVAPLLALAEFRRMVFSS
ncbi:MAG: prenyltransferase/squalene oxidase repeat-containing protein [Gemmataceae bacterium]